MTVARCRTSAHSGGGSSWGYDINDSGQVAGFSEITGDSAIHAFLYDGSTMQDLGTLGGASSRGYGINASGQVVGGSDNSSGQWRGFLYDNGSMLDLCALVDCVAAGWDFLAEAWDINDSGAITGRGGINGRTHAFLMTVVPIPVTIDIEPGKDPNIINLKSGGFVSVAVLTEGDFDALQVDPDTATFGPSEEAVTARYQVTDVDKDGDEDFVLYFRIQQTGIACSDKEATLTGELHDGTPFTGTDSIVTKNCTTP